MAYRIYIDETGNTDRGATNDPNRRFLSLTGVIAPHGAEEQLLLPALNTLRARHFNHSANRPVILHRADIMKCKHPFDSLTDDAARHAWREDIFQFFEQQQYTIITACVDKVAFYFRHPNWTDDPYHLCIFNMLERYFFFLQSRQTTGDVVAETRNSQDNRKFLDAFSELYNEGSNYISARDVQRRFISDEPQILGKRADVAALQLADLLARPSLKACQRIYINFSAMSNFDRRIARLLEEQKYHRSDGNQRDGYGRLWRPQNRRQT